MNRKNNKDAIIFRHDVILKFSWRCFVSRVKLSYWSKFHVNVVTGSGVMTISFVRDWPEIWKLEITLSEFSPKSADWSDIGIPNLAKMYLTKCCWILQNARVTAFTVSELLKENQQGVKLPPAPPPSTQIRSSKHSSWWRRLEDVFKTSSRRLAKTSSKRLQDVLQKTLQDIFKTSCKNLFKTSSRCLRDVFKTSSRRPHDTFKTPSTRFEDVLKTFWRCLEDARNPNAFKTYHQVILFLLTSFQDVFKTYSQRFWGVLQRRLSTEGFA